MSRRETKEDTMPYDKVYRRTRLARACGFIFVALACVLLAWVARAEAEPFTPELEADYQRALASWGISAPPQCASVQREVLATADPYGEGTAGRTSQPPPGAQDFPCFIHLYEPALEEQFPAGCWREAMMRHEVGHLLGYGHSDDPESIMSAAGLHGACLLTLFPFKSSTRLKLIENLRLQRLILLEDCSALNAGKHRQRCWEKTRRLMRRLRVAVNRYRTEA